jgi:hypothetical protein
VRLPFNGDYPIIQRFNDACCRASYAQFGMNGHNGIDYGLPAGTEVLAAHSGTAFVKSDPPGFGNYIEVQNNEIKTTYAHLSKTNVANGQYVSEGQHIGLSGNTGNSSGPHLHFGLKPINPDNNNGFFGAVDPQPYLDNSKGNDMTKNQATDLALYVRLAAGATVAEAKASSAYDVEHILADPGYAAALAKQIYGLNELFRYKASRYDDVARQVENLTVANKDLQQKIAEAGASSGSQISDEDRASLISAREIINRLLGEN